MIFKVICQGHQVKFWARGYATLCIALVVGCFVDIGGVVFVFNGVEVIVGCFVDIGGVAYHHNYNFFS